MAIKEKYELSDIDLYVATEMLSYCNVSDRDEWLAMGMSIKSEFGEAGFDIWDTWSKLDDSYKPAATKSSWRSFKGGAINIGKLIRTAMDAGFKFEQKEVNEADRTRLNEQRENRMAVRATEQLEEQAQIDAWRLKLSDFLMDNLNHFEVDGTTDYLDKKHVPGYGVLFAKNPMVLVADQDRDLLEAYIGYDRYQEFWKIPKDDRPKFRVFKKGTFAVPMADIENRLWNLQSIYAHGGKTFFPGKKQGCFHILGNIPAFGRFNVCQAEGYATAAAIHMALGCPVVVAFDSGNMVPVAKAIKTQYGDRISRFAFCADDDQHLVDQNKKNAGLVAATDAALAVGGIVIIPLIDDEITQAEKPENDLLFDEAIAFVIETRKSTLSSLQRKLRIGYNRAARIMDELHNAGHVSAPDNSGKREVITEPKEGATDHG